MKSIIFPKVLLYGILIMFLLKLPLELRSQWEILEPYPVQNFKARDIYFTDSLHGWTCGENGVYRTINGGEGWSLCNDTSGIQNEYLSSISFVDESNGWIAGYNGLFYTSNGGESWEKKSNERLWTVDFLNMDSGWIGGWEYIANTNDGGDSWNIVGDPGDTDITDIQYVTDQNVFSVAAFYDLVNNTVTCYYAKSQDSGSSWQTGSFSGDDIWDICFLDSLNGWCVLDDRVKRTNDFGETWSTIPIGGKSIHFYSPQIGWIGANGKIFYTVNGIDFEEYNLYQDYTIRSIHFIDSIHGWAVGVSNTNNTSIILRTSNGGIITGSTEICIRENVLRINPNPVDSELSLINIAQGIITKIFIYSMNGQLLFQQKYSGSSLDVSQLNPGIYIIQVMQDGNIYSQKFVKL